MSIEDKMTIDERRKYLRKMKERYLRANRQERGQLLDKTWVYYNLFQPVMRLSEKIWTREEGQPSRVKRRFDKAATPFDRLCATNALSSERKEQLETLRDQTNPRQLRQVIYELIDHITALPRAAPGVTEDVRRTLMTDLNETT